MKHSLLLAFCWILTGNCLKAAEILEVRKIWDAAPHNAFTDLLRHDGTWYCVFREGSKHVSADGALRVLVSKDGQKWESSALIRHPTADLRDTKITETPDHRLMLNGAGAFASASGTKHQSFAWLSKDGKDWSEPIPVGETNNWLWRVTWHEGKAYGVGYGTTQPSTTKLFVSRDGRSYEILVPVLFGEGFPNEASLLFQPDDTALCLLRRDGTPGSGQLGMAKPPYTSWEWKDLGVKIGGPQLLRLPDGRIVAGGRLYDGGARMSLCWLDSRAGKLEEFLKLPSGGDCSYPGLVWHEGVLWVSYYSSHEGKTSIYLARVKLDSGK
ncbi:MAG: hypothetical protein JWM16_1183 [Verrucomicrobiales bacterium]|nr:hypothetical protein [Verrucomicrobiales bacterium]